MAERLKVLGLVTVTVKRVDGSIDVICKDNPNLLTLDGRDWIHSQIYNSGTSDEAKYIALSSDAVAPVDTDIILDGEIVAGGLERASATVTHTIGTSTTIISNSFTATNTFTNVQKTGLFTAISGGVLVHENNFTPVSGTTGDQLTISWNISLV